MTKTKVKNKKLCPHCNEYKQTGGAFQRHELSCARKHNATPISDPLPKRGTPRQHKPDPPTLTEETDYLGGDFPWVMWDRGEWRGWAFGRVSKLGPTFVNLTTPHLGKISWDRRQFENDVREGRVFFINPNQIIEALLVQLEGLFYGSLSKGSKGHEQALKGLGQALKGLQAIREHYREEHGL